MQKLHPKLESQINKINFYRFCQLIEKSYPDAPLLGSTHHPRDDQVRFLPHPGMGFPVSELKNVEYNEEDPQGIPSVRTTFMGLYGVDSPLPTSFLDEIAQKREGHEAIQGFLDIFNHRILTQFYRIWRKYSYPASFENGGTDKISQSLLGLVGLGIPGIEHKIATPVSRFLALLSVLRQPGRTREGVQALVNLIAPNTSAEVSPHSLRNVRVSTSSLENIMLDGNSPLGEEVIDANTQILIELYTEDLEDAKKWMPDEQCYQDFLVLLRVYLGWRYKAKIKMTLATQLLALPALGENNFALGLTGVLGMQEDSPDPQIPHHFTIELGTYQGMTAANEIKGSRHVRYQYA